MLIDQETVTNLELVQNVGATIVCFSVLMDGLAMCRFLTRDRSTLYLVYSIIAAQRWPLVCFATAS